MRDQNPKLEDFADTRTLDQAPDEVSPAPAPSTLERIARGTYYRWTSSDDTNQHEVLSADILGDAVEIMAYPIRGKGWVKLEAKFYTPDELRMIGVRLIEAATLADNGRSTREQG